MLQEINKLVSIKRDRKKYQQKFQKEKKEGNVTRYLFCKSDFT